MYGVDSSGTYIQCGALVIPPGRYTFCKGLILHVLAGLAAAKTIEWKSSSTAAQPVDRLQAKVGGPSLMPYIPPYSGKNQKIYTFMHTKSLRDRWLHSPNKPYLAASMAGWFDYII